MTADGDAEDTEHVIQSRSPEKDLDQHPGKPSYRDSNDPFVPRA